MSGELGFQPWKPQAKSKLIVDQVNDILSDYSEHLPLTNRVIFYRMNAVHGFPKTEPNYKLLCGKISRGRRAGFIDWAAIRDDRVTFRPAPGYSSKAELIEDVQNAIENFTIAAHRGQPIRVELWVEAAGMVPQAERAVAGLGVDVYSSSGFGSCTMKHEAAQRIARTANRGVGTVVLHVGDHDPSGVSMFDNLNADLSAFMGELVGTDDVVSFERVAITPDQAEEYGAPSAPPKKEDSRSKKFRGETWQAEALPPDALERIIRDAALQWINLDDLAATEALGQHDRDDLRERFASAFTD